MPLVLDSSIAGCWCFPDEASAVADMAWDRLQVDGAVVPALWWYEVRNVLVVNERRGRIDQAGTAEFLADLEGLPVHVDRAPVSDVIFAHARAHRLTFYDAAYLELARRLDAPLATLDRALGTAARSAGVPLLE